MEMNQGRGFWVRAWKTALAVAAVSLTCSCATGYHPLRHGTGFSEQQVAANEFRVSFKGSGHTSSPRAADFVLLRAAQVALQHGFPWFAVLDITNRNEVYPYTATSPGYAAPLPSPYSPYGYGFLYGGNWVYPEQQRLFVRPGSTLLIKGYSAKPEKPFTYDAKALELSLSRKYHVAVP